MNSVKSHQKPSKIPVVQKLSKANNEKLSSTTKPKMEEKNGLALDEFSNMILNEPLNVRRSISMDKLPAAAISNEFKVNNKIYSKTPSAKRELIFAKGAKFNPNHETGIPWIRPKKTTKPVPFHFVSEERAKLKAKVNHK